METLNGKQVSDKVGVGDVVWFTPEQAKKVSADPWLYVVEDTAVGGGHTGMSQGDYYPEYHEAALRRLADERNYDPEGQVVRVAQGCNYSNIEVGSLEVWGKMKKIFVW